jgi:hypothetical protein
MPNLQRDYAASYTIFHGLRSAETLAVLVEKITAAS